MNKSQKKNHVHSKWLKTRVLLSDARLRALVPETRRLNEGSLKSMLRRYRMVYIKPVSGTYGNGVMKVEQRSESGRPSYSCHYLEKKRLFRSFPALYASIVRYKWNSPYLVQKGIRLLTHRGRAFDIRVMVQKNSRNRWETTGIIGRVASRGKIVTNYHSGGKPIDAQTLLKPYLSTESLHRFNTTLALVGAKAAETLGKAFPGVNMVGADIGIDSHFHPWIIELNTKPDPYIFKHLKDKSVYCKVLRYAKALRRVPSTNRRRILKNTLNRKRRRVSSRTDASRNV
ncbi:YheC/YheD family protein [Cohnella pontilimi]|uniref:YheC/YheD family protein n=1 Tax=Cohnella pontilimi TaxID=2564100 RepID=A0A4U0FGC6_9BACL|nr:YheC/YheD family protein [Cohnella pontilimi]TJY43938.1 YheC/YheD family protein [Cohnella pontilimi]